MSKLSQLLISFLRNTFTVFTNISLKIFRRSRQTTTSLILLISLGVALAVVLPVHSEDDKLSSSPAKLTQKGEDFYAAGRLDKAIETWQQAAEAYTALGNDQASRDTYLNTATAQQALGLYDRSCDSLLSAFKITSKTDCNQIIQEAQEIEPQLDSNQPLNQATKSKLLPAIATINQQPKDHDKAQGLLRFGDYLRAKGYPRVASQALELSLTGSEKLDDPQQKTATLLSLGNAQRAIAEDKQNQFSTQTIVLDVIANNSASATSALESYQPALNYYQQAAAITPRQADNVKAELNRLGFLLDIQNYWQGAITDFNNNLEFLAINDSDFLEELRVGSKTLKQDLNQQLDTEINQALTKLRPEVNQLSPTREGIYSRLNFAQSLMKHGENDRQTAEVLATAIKQARSLKNLTAEAEATGTLGSLYQKQGQYSSARRLTESALQLAPTAEYPDIAYRWNAQLGKILAAQGERKQGLAAYETSFNTIKTLRSDLATTPVEPIFREYISLLLQEKPSSEQLAQARNVLESLQVATLDNFFRDPCSEVAEQPVAIDDVDSKAAVIYPILLQDRLEVILTLPGKPLRHFTTSNLTPEKVNNTIQQLRRNALTNPGFAEEIRGARGNPQGATALAQLKTAQVESLQTDILPLAAEIYGWLIEPAEAELKASGVKTLVFVLDGSLRNIPMSLLYDQKEEKYLIQKDFDVAISSGLQLTAPKPLKREPIKVLAAGVTSEYPLYRFPPIPKVEDELNTIKQIFAKSEILLNKEFTKATLEQKLQESDFPVVHLATHGQFGSTAEQTFILSGTNQGDPSINVNQFDNLLRAGNLKRSQPIELLVLSACNTAEGDSRAILGLAGVAVRAGARSTLATLWSADDEATANLMGKFYRNLFDDPQISKAGALRKAQLDLLAEADSQYRHPFYWAPFVLVGNWL